MKWHTSFFWPTIVLCSLIVSGCGTPGMQKIRSSMRSTTLVMTNVWCMTRTDSAGNVSHKTVYGPASATVWEVDDGRIHAEHNKYADCIGAMKGGCNIEPKEVFSITAAGGVYSYERIYGTPAGESPETATLAPTPAPTPTAVARYLSGPVTWASGKTGEVFVLYTGTMSQCIFPGITNEPLKPCNTFDIELYPDGVSGWEHYRPDGAKWDSGMCIGSASPQEPGGGGGHDPP